MTAGEWRLVSDSKGEFSIWHPSADSANVDLRKDGYKRLLTAKEFRQQMTRKTGDTILLYLTPPADEALEEIKVLLEGSLFAVEQKKRYSGELTPYPQIAASYVRAKSIAKTPRERELLRGFCEHSSGVKSLGEGDWWAYQHAKGSAAELVRFCESP